MPIFSLFTSLFTYFFDLYTPSYLGRQAFGKITVVYTTYDYTLLKNGCLYIKIVIHYICLYCVRMFYILRYNSPGEFYRLPPTGICDV